MRRDTRPTSLASRALRGLRAAARCKARGNEAHGAGEYEAAAAAYSEGLEADGEELLRALLLGNRSVARLRAGRAADALDDAEGAATLDRGESARPLLRRAECYVALGRAAAAAADYEAALALDPGNEAAAAGLAACRSCGGNAAAGAAAEEEDAEEDAYELLGVPRDASATQVKQAYRRQALKYHPDRHVASDAAAAAERRFKALSIAHAVLSDAGKRRRYDAGGRLRDLAWM